MGAVFTLTEWGEESAKVRENGLTRQSRFYSVYGSWGWSIEFAAGRLLLGAPQQLIKRQLSKDIEKPHPNLYGFWKRDCSLLG